MEPVVSEPITFFRRATRTTPATGTATDPTPAPAIRPKSGVSPRGAGRSGEDPGAAPGAAVGVATATGTGAGPPDRTVTAGVEAFGEEGEAEGAGAAVAAGRACLPVLEGAGAGAGADGAPEDPVAPACRVPG